MVPLLLQNKPPTLEGREDDELADLELRPEQVRKIGYIYSVHVHVRTYSTLSVVAYYM